MSVSQRVSREQLRTASPLLIAWLASRALLVLFTYNKVPYIDHGSLVGDVQTYNKWSLVFAHGHFPLHDPQWQYPPGAAVFIVLPRAVKYLTGLSYYQAFYAMALLSDLIVFLLVVFACWRTAARVDRTGGKFSVSYAAGAADAARLVAADGGVDGGNGNGGGSGDGGVRRRTGSRVPKRGYRIDYTGAWAYIAAIFALGPIVLCRYDICVTMVATVALVVIGRTTAGTWRVRGGATGVGTMMKIWPAVVLLGVPKKTDGRRAVVWAVLGVLVPTLALMAVLPGALGFLREQGDRGLEIESVLAAPFMIARHLGYPGKIIHAYGAFEITGPGLGVISSGCVVLTVAGLMWLLRWRRRAVLVPGRWSTGLFYDSSLVAVLITIITSRVLSPQYLAWVIGLIALCLTLTPLGRNGTVLAKPCWLLLAAISVTQIEFPWLFPKLVEGSAWVAVLVAARDLMLVAATWQAARALWRAAVDQVPARTDEPAGDPLATDGTWDPAPPQYQGLPDQVS